MIPKQTPVRNFCPAAPCRLPLHTSFPVDLPREKNLRASLSSSQSIPSPGNRTRQKYLVSQSFVTAQCRSRTACYLALSASSSVPPFPQPTAGKEPPCLLVIFSKHTVAGKPYTAKMSCVAILCDRTAPLPYRLSSRAFRQNPRKKREARFGASLRSVSGGIRTRDLQSRSLTRCPAALQTQSTLLLYLVLRRRARPSFIPACSACVPPVSRSAPGRRAVPRPLSPGSRGRCEGAVPLPCDL